MRSFLIGVCFVVAGCHGHSDYLTLQDCFDEHTDVEGYPPDQAITICTLDHDIDGEILVFLTVDECIAYVDAELTVDSATDAEIEAGCEDYINQGGN